MNESDLLTSLPTSLFCSVLRDWLCLKSVVTLDTAYCSKANRSCFEDLLQSEEYFVRERISISNNETELRDCCRFSKFGWKIRSVEFKNVLSVTQSRMLDHCRYLLCVHYVGQDRTSQAIWGLLEANVNIESLSLTFYTLLTFPPLAELPSPPTISLPNLRSFGLFGFSLQDDKIMEALKISDQLAKLDLSQSNVSRETVLQIVQQCRRLVSLGLAATPLDNEVLRAIATFCPDIKHLNIEGGDVFRRTNGITDAGILAVAQNLKSLQSLNINDHDNLSDDSLVHIYTYCKDTLHTLHLRCRTTAGGQTYGAIAMHELLERCTQLRTLYFGYWHVNTTFDTDITLPATTLRNLKVLVLRGNVVCDRNITAIGRYGHNLQKVGIFGTSTYLYGTLKDISVGCPSLSELYGRFDLIPGDDMDMWAVNRPEVFVSTSLSRELSHFNVLDM